MKRIYTTSLLIAIAAVAMLHWGCSKNDFDESVFEKTPEERTAQLLAEYKSTLTSADAWTAYVYPSGGGGFTFYFKFDSTNRVEMFADIDEKTIATPKESQYSIRPLQIPTLVFETYSYLHMLEDPDAAVLADNTSKGKINQLGALQGTSGSGLKSDFEFYLMKVTKDTVWMQGAKNGTEVVLVKTTAAKYNANKDKSGTQKTAIETALFFYNNSLTSIELPNGKRVMMIMGGNRTLSHMSQVNATVLDSSSSSTVYSFTPSGIHLRKAMKYGNYTITDIENVNNGKQLFAKIENVGLVEMKKDSVESISLYVAFRAGFMSGMYIPPVGVEGSSASFNDTLAKLKSNLLAGNFILKELSFQYSGSQMYVGVQSSRNDTTYSGYFLYNIKAQTDGSVRYTYATTNAEGIRAEMKPLLDCIEKRAFKLDYYRTSTGTNVGRMTDVNSSGFYLTGYFF